MLKSPTITDRVDVAVLPFAHTPLSSLTHKHSRDNFEAAMEEIFRRSTVQTVVVWKGDMACECIALVRCISLDDSAVMAIGSAKEDGSAMRQPLRLSSLVLAAIRAAGSPPRNVFGGLTGPIVKGL